MVSDCTYGLTELSCFRVSVLGDGEAIMADLSSVCSCVISSGDLTSWTVLWKRSRGIVYVLRFMNSQNDAEVMPR